MSRSKRNRMKLRNSRSRLRISIRNPEFLVLVLGVGILW